MNRYTLKGEGEPMCKRDRILLMIAFMLSFFGSLVFVGLVMS